ncbi:MAG: nitrous oxide reductase family maturation protein NosD [Myxococcales bacterium]|nr:nitrous oxide reductase family maturation protein NosD [Myxococcales bacterium]
MVGLITIAACASKAAPRVSAPAPLPAPPRPADCLTVAAGSNLQSTVDGAREGAVLCLEPGSYAGPLTIAKRVEIWGPRDAVIRSGGEGTTIEIEGGGAALAGLTVDGSGGRFDTLDAAVHVVADDVRVEGVRVQGAAFGLLIEKANRASILNNVVQGPDDGPLGLRGDGIRLWETRDSVVRDNRVLGCRDMVVWYSSRNRLVRNTVVRSRYGTHFMYSHDNHVEGNRYIDNVVGIFIMYSRNLMLRDNLLARSTGPGGMGLGIKESGNLTVTGNAFIANTKGVYMDTAPLEPEDFNAFEDNAFFHSEVAVLMHSSEKRNAFRGNQFVSNRSQLQVEGGGDALGVEWDGNSFDDYAGYDMDRDGFGDIPYELRRLSSQLESTYPQLQFFRGAITLQLLDAISSLFPMVEPKTTMIDARPKMGAVDWSRFDAR